MARAKCASVYELQKCLKDKNAHSALKYAGIKCEDSSNLTSTIVVADKHFTP